MRLLVLNDRGDVVGVVENYELFDRDHEEGSEGLLQALLDIDNRGGTVVAPNGTIEDWVKGLNTITEFSPDGCARCVEVDVGIASIRASIHAARDEIVAAEDERVDLLDQVQKEVTDLCFLLGADMNDSDYNRRKVLCDRAQRLVANHRKGARDEEPTAGEQRERPGDPDEGRVEDGPHDRGEGVREPEGARGEPCDRSPADDPGAVDRDPRGGDRVDGESDAGAPEDGGIRVARGDQPQYDTVRQKAESLWVLCQRSQREVKAQWDRVDELEREARAARGVAVAMSNHGLELSGALAELERLEGRMDALIQDAELAGDTVPIAEPDREVVREAVECRFRRPFEDVMPSATWNAQVGFWFTVVDGEKFGVDPTGYIYNV
jgi:hypothetical protein